MLDVITHTRPYSNAVLASLYPCKYPGAMKFSIWNLTIST